MKLAVKCPKCDHINPTPNHEDNRVEYAKKHGKEFNIICNKCNELSLVKVNDVHAFEDTTQEVIKSNFKAIAAIFLVVLGLSFYITGFFGAVAIALVSSIISVFLFRKVESDKRLSFNKRKIKKVQQASA